MHKKVHGSDKYRCLTISYSILSCFEVPKSDPSLPSSLHDQYARGVVGCCEGAVSTQTCLICFAILAMPACSLACSALYGFACLVCFATLVHLATLLACFVCLLWLLCLFWFILCVNTRNSTKRRLTTPFGWVSGVQLTCFGLAWASKTCAWFA